MGNRSRDISKDIVTTRGKKIELSFRKKKKDERFDKFKFNLSNHKFNNGKFDK